MSLPQQFGKKYIFLPDASCGTVRYLSTEDLEKISIKGVVVNTLHMLIGVGDERVNELGGIKKFMNWNGWVLSDSGGFQVFSLVHRKKWEGEISEDGVIFKSPKNGQLYNITPETSIDIQVKLGSDILVVLDDCRDAEISREEAEISVRRTIDWARRSKEYFEKKYSDIRKSKKLTAVVQGANFTDLREECAKELVKIGFDGYNFGGYVIDSKGKLVIDVMKVLIDNTPSEKFRYAMGVGKPYDMLDCAKLGYTVFDTVLVTRNARHGTLYSFDEIDKDFILRIKNAKYGTDLSPVDSTCDCELCRNHTRAYLNNLLRVGEASAYRLASIHNLRFYTRLIESLNQKGIDISVGNREFLSSVPPAI